MPRITQEYTFTGVSENSIQTHSFDKATSLPTAVRLDIKIEKNLVHTFQETNGNTGDFGWTSTITGGTYPDPNHAGDAGESFQLVAVRAGTGDVFADIRYEPRQLTTLASGELSIIEESIDATEITYFIPAVDLADWVGTGKVPIGYTLEATNYIAGEFDSYTYGYTLDLPVKVVYFI